MTDESRKERTKNVYVIRLDEEVLKQKRFLEANPDYRKGKPCYYVGSTALTPDERFEQHRAGQGHKASRWVRRYGKHLARRKFERRNPVPNDKTEAEERKLARELRKKGYGVWQN